MLPVPSWKIDFIKHLIDRMNDSLPQDPTAVADCLVNQVQILLLVL